MKALSLSVASLTTLMISTATINLSHAQENSNVVAATISQPNPLLSSQQTAMSTDSTRSMGSWFIRPTFSASILSDQTATASSTGTLDGQWTADTKTGFAAGLGVGYRYTPQVTFELFWEYRTNDTDTLLVAEGDLFSGNYASNLFYFNGYYSFPSRGQWSPYLGVGLGWVQEIDIDLESAGLERSFSAEGDVSLQVMAGVDYAIADRLAVNAELRYGNLTSVSVEGEENAVGIAEGLDYQPVSLGVGMKYAF
jgi:opacity protein-like surface antigen